MNSKKRFRVILIVLLLGITVGFAILSANLTINGNSIIANSTWDIHFDNVVPKEGRVSIGENESEAIINPNDNTEVTYNVTLSKPGDFYEFNVDVVNQGTIDGQVESITSTLKLNSDEPFVITDNNLPEYLSYSITYSDDTAIEANHLLKAGETETYKVRVEFKRDIDENILPEEDQSLLISIKPTLIQKNEEGEEREKEDVYTPFTYETDVDSVQGTIVQYDDINQENCVLYFSQNLPEEIDAETYCRGDNVTYQENTFNIYDELNEMSAFQLQNLSDDGVITLKYVQIKSYDIDEENCITALNNMGWYDNEEDRELYCSGGKASDNLSIQDDIDEGYLNELINAGIIKNVVYEKVKGDIIITGYKEEVPSNLVIPNEINGQKVVGIADNSFANMNISSVEIPNTVEYIGDKSFIGNKIKNLNIPNSVKSIGKRAFYNNNLSSVVLGSQNTITGNCSFGNKNEITTNNIPETYKCLASCETGESNYNNGYQYTNGQYTYTYTFNCPGNSDFCFDDETTYGWKVQLTDKDSTEPVTTNACNYVDDIPIIDMSYMFSNSKATSIDVSSFDTSNVTNMSNMFYRVEASEIIGLDTLVTSNVLNMNNMFESIKIDELDLSSFDTSNVENMGSMFKSIKADELDLSSFDTAKVKDMSYMFCGADNLRKIYVSDKFVTSALVISNDIFSYCNNLIGGNGTTYESLYNSYGAAKIDGKDGQIGLFTDINDKIPRMTSGKIVESCTGSCLKKNNKQGVPTVEGLYQDEHGNYRYAGNDPYNYAEFNGEIWRIIGIFDGKIKIIRERSFESDITSINSIGSYSWDSSEGESSLDDDGHVVRYGGFGVNQWSPSGTYEGSDLYKLLNDYYYNGVNDGICYNNWFNESTTCNFPGLNSKAKSLIDNSTWYLGAISSSDITAVEAYDIERGNATCHNDSGIGCIDVNRSNPDDNVVRTTYGTGKVGLLYPSDYGYASAKCRNKNVYLSNYSSSCLASNWLTMKFYNSWLLTPSSNNPYKVWGISSGNLYEYYYASTSANVYPTVYLKSNVKISGTGKNIDGERFTFSLD